MRLVFRSDEHGQKVAASAEKGGLSPKSHCDFYVDSFKALNKRLAISCSRYVRTTDPDHELTAQVLCDLPRAVCIIINDCFSYFLSVCG